MSMLFLQFVTEWCSSGALQGQRVSWGVVVCQDS